ncbi:MAG: HD domain-containing protein [Anaerolineae bacterium]|nr:HD domain-containing protein [Anaerolineae bacterium]
MSELRPGLQLARDVSDGKGGLLLRRGVSLNSSYIRALDERGFAWVYVVDEVSDGIVVEDMVAGYLRSSAESVLRSLAGLQSGMAGQQRRLPEALMEQELGDVSRVMGHVLSAGVLTALARMASVDTTLLFHGLHTATAALWLGWRMSLNEGSMRSLALGGMLHDCGKAKLSHHTFLLPTLSPEQQADLQRHPLLGLQMTRELGVDDQDAIAAVAQHHERQDGRGYPRGLRGTNRIASGYQTGRIALAAEVIALADAYAMLTTETLVTAPLAAGQVARALHRLSGTVLNRQLVRHLLEGRRQVPIGIGVYVASGRHSGCRGTVVRNSCLDPEHVVVRLVQDSGGGRMRPVELDTAEEEGACLLAELS